MKNCFWLSLIVVSFLFAKCAPNKEVTPTLDYKKEEIKLMEEVALGLVGRWNFREVEVNYQLHKLIQGNRLELSKDTTFKDLATLDIQPASKNRFNPKQPQHPEFEGTLQFQGKTYPVYFYLLAGPRVTSKEGPHAFFLFDYWFPDGMHIPEAEEIYLQNMGLTGENFSLEILPGQQTMIWKGLNRGINKVNLQKL
jgi:hypothetical protein